MLSVNFSYVCFIHAEIFEIMSSGGLEVSFSIHVYVSINRQTSCRESQSQQRFTAER